MVLLRPSVTLAMRVAAVAIKQAVAGLAVRPPARPSVPPSRWPVVPAGVVKAFHPAVAADVVAVRHRGDGVGEGAVVDGEGSAGRDPRDTGRPSAACWETCALTADPHPLAEIDLVVDVVLFEVGQQEGRPAPARPHVVVGGAGGVRVAIDVAGRKQLVGVVIDVQGQADLLEVVGALACGAAASRTFCTAGSSRPIRMAMMAMTTSSSISVKAERFFMVVAPAV